MVETGSHETAARILDSVMHLILHGGLPAVTLSAVCKHANISKGGLVYHFPTKEALVEAFVRRASEQYVEMVQQAISKQPVGSGRRAKAFIDLFLADPQSFAPEANRDCAAVMLALIQGGGRTLYGINHYELILQLLRQDGMSPGTAEMIVSTIDGVWLQSLIEPSDSLLPRAARIRKQLRKVIDQEISQQRLHRKEKQSS